MLKLNFSKKGDTTLLKELVYLVVGIMALVVIFTKGGPVIMGLFYDTPDKVSVSNYERLLTEIKSVLIEYQDWEKDYSVDTDEKILNFKRKVPLNFDEKLGIKFYNPDDEMPVKCRKKNLPCVCIAYFEKFTNSGEVYKCKNIEQNVDFLFDYYQGNSGQGNLIRGQGIGSFELFFLIDDAGKLNLKIVSNFDVVEDLYVPFLDVCGEQCNYLAWGDERSASPKGSPFGKIKTEHLAGDSIYLSNTIITAPFKSKVYFETIQSRVDKDLDPVHYAIDIVPNYVNYDTVVSDDLVNFRIGQPISKKTVFYSTCDGVVNTIGISQSGTYFIIINCDDGEHSIDLRHNSVHFVKDGDIVKYGQPIAIMGNTGPSSGAHIHYVIKKERVPVNPLFYMDSSVFKQRENDDFEREAMYQLETCNNAIEQDDVCVVQAFERLDSEYDIPAELKNVLNVPENYLQNDESEES